jgi:hypothetical protein
MSRTILFLSALLPLLAPLDAGARVTITRTNYHGWLEAYVMSNGKAAAVIVPAIGRVMQFGFVGEEGVFWENHALDGRIADGQLVAWATKDWVNFGGDKTWPSPESDWSLFTGRKGWRPPPAFDGWPSSVRISGGTLTLVTEVDPFFGTFAERSIRLHSSKPEMTITTTYTRKQGEPAWIGIWVITQLKEPAGLFAPVPAKSIFPESFALLGQDPPPSLKFTNGIVSLTRNPKTAHKIGLDADSLLWVGEKHVLRIDSPRVRKGDYPDRGSNTEIYTSPDPLPYIELETLGPLHSMKAGDKIERVNTYTLSRRTRPTPEAEARAVFGR